MSLEEIYKNFSAPEGGGDKGTAHSYIGIYEQEMAKTEVISLLEIGIWEGHSIAMWQSYFKDSEILGVDITDKRLKFDIPVLLADATKPIPALFDRKFDYIIDDGSHLVHDQIASFELLWGNLKIGGKYFIEDILGDKELAQLRDRLTELGVRFKVYDCRNVKGRLDDILLVAEKE